MKKTSWIITIIGSVIGLFVLFNTLMSASSAPQEAAGAAIAVAFAVIPYCIARSVTEIQTKKSESE